MRYTAAEACTVLQAVMEVEPGDSSDVDTEPVAEDGAMECSTSAVVEVPVAETEAEQGDISDSPYRPVPLVVCTDQDSSRLRCKNFKPKLGIVYVDDFNESDNRTVHRRNVIRDNGVAEVDMTIKRPRKRRNPKQWKTNVKRKKFDWVRSSQKVV